MVATGAALRSLFSTRNSCSNLAATSSWLTHTGTKPATTTLCTKKFCSTFTDLNLYVSTKLIIRQVSTSSSARLSTLLAPEAEPSESTSWATAANTVIAYTASWMPIASTAGTHSSTCQMAQTTLIKSVLHRNLPAVRWFGQGKPDSMVLQSTTSSPRVTIR